MRIVSTFIFACLFRISTCFSPPFDALPLLSDLQRSPNDTHLADLFQRLREQPQIFEQAFQSQSEEADQKLRSAFEPPTPLGQGPRVQTDLGIVEGNFESNRAVESFLGIPFAAPPTGERRFRAPQPAEPWNGVRPAKEISPECLQVALFQGAEKAMHEDCLYLNVWRPKGATAGDNLPVMVWIHGGGFIFGKGKYDGGNLASMYNVIIVSTNYRLGALGFSALETLAKEDSFGSTGNYGVQDQRAALQWTQRNIEAFGGDPDSVTLFGQSAGAVSVCFHLASVHSAGLFHRAISQSGPCRNIEIYFPREDAVRWHRQRLTELGCSDPDSPAGVQCLRQLPASTFVPSIFDLLTPYDDYYDEALIFPPMAWGPVIDGSEAGLLVDPVTMLASGRGNDVALLVGTTADDGSYFSLLPLGLMKNFKLPITEESFRRVLGWFMNRDPKYVDRAVELYPASDFPSGLARLATIIQDWMLVCPSRALATVMREQGHQVWLYKFDPELWWIEALLFGVFHGAEHQFVFHNEVPHKFNANDKKMAEDISRWWTNFAKFGDPNGLEAIQWPEFRTDGSQPFASLRMRQPSNVELRLREKYCDFFDTLPFYRYRRRQQNE